MLYPCQVPLTSALGRRPPLIMATLLAFLASLGSAMATNFNLLFVCVFLAGFAEGFALTVVGIYSNLELMELTH